ncbi:hypothetical protein [Streptomyces sp. NBC_00038]|uniref:hypothetical protein n=1 Tax=Streptomyces sp. NBC_00038 TaxID=2903615 RepID=UPI0022599E9C|nr:hypothetical protein [Streptomyces sp. NBC_00038]MCX5555779.1 hypothetical protein [Streptomyces sp. NBC_00038]
MSDLSGRTPEGPVAPDFLDRLIARHALGAAPRPGVVRVRPRLTGPFERVEAVRTGASDAQEPVWPTVPQLPSDNDGLTVRPTSREVHFRTEREQTVVRTERSPQPARSASHATEREAPVVPLLRPAAAVTPGLRPVPEAGRRSARARAGFPAAPSAASVPTPPGTEAASTAVSTPPRPSAADTAAARDAVRQVAGRRAGRGAEHVVQVQIGRLEVTAAPSPSAGGRTQAPAVRRPGATVSLEEYLARGRE